MRCPVCNFVCSELRDVCPKCLLDIRPYKKSIGLPITNPHASYDELIGRGKTKPIAQAPAKTESAASLTFGGFFKNLFKKTSSSESEAHDQERPSVKSAQKSSLVSAPPSQILPEDSPASPAFEQTDSELQEEMPQLELPHKPSGPAVLDFSQVEQNLDSILGDFSSEEPLQVSALRDEKPAAPAQLSPDEIEIIFEDEQEAIESLTEEPSSYMQDDSGQGFQSEGQETPQPLIDIGACDEQAPGSMIGPASTLAAASIEKPQQPQSSTREHSASIAEAQRDTDVIAADDLSTLFTLARKELEGGAAIDTAFELSSEQLAGVKNHQQVLLLFDLARDAIKDPAFEGGLVSEIATSAERRVETVGLDQELKKVQSVLESPQITLKGIKSKPESLRPPEAQMPAAPPAALPASIARRIGANALDLVCVLLLSSCCGVLLHYWYSSPSPFSKVSVLEWLNKSYDVFDGLIILQYAIGSFLIFIIAYPAITASIFRSTLGMLLMRIQIRRNAPTKHGRIAPSPLQMLVRAMCVPISTVLLGFLAPLWGKRTLHDYLAGTELIRSR